MAPPITQNSHGSQFATYNCYTSLQSVRSDTQWHFPYRAQLVTACIEHVCVQHSARLVRRTIISPNTNRSSPKPNHNNTSFPRTVRAGTVCIQSTQRIQKRYTDAQYETRLALLSCKLISHTSLRILFFFLRSANNSEHFSCTAVTFAGVWTSMFGIFTTLHIWHYTHIDHNKCQFGCDLSIAKDHLPAEPCDISISLLMLSWQFLPTRDIHAIKSV
jgi:hypothetical protein